jgi:hypothetical protein
MLGAMKIEILIVTLLSATALQGQVCPKPDLTQQYFTIISIAKKELPPDELIKKIDRLVNLSENSLAYEKVLRLYKAGYTNTAVTIQKYAKFKKEDPSALSEATQMIWDHPENLELIERALKSRAPYLRDYALSFSWRLGKKAEPFILDGLARNREGAAQAFAKMNDPDESLADAMIRITDPATIHSFEFELRNGTYSPAKMRALLHFFIRGYRRRDALDAMIIWAEHDNANEVLQRTVAQIKKNYPDSIQWNDYRDGIIRQW